MSNYVSFEATDGSGKLPIKEPYSITTINNNINVVKCGQLVIVNILNWLDITVSEVWTSVAIAKLPYKPVTRTMGTFTTPNNEYQNMCIYVGDDGVLYYNSSYYGDYSLSGHVVYITDD